MSADEVANAFVNHYYSTISTGPQALAGLYQPHSKATWEGQLSTGPQQIIAKLSSFGKLEYNIPALTKDVQIGVNDNSLIIFVTGQLKIETNPPINFAQVFQLVATGPGQYYVNNEVFRLTIA